MPELKHYKAIRCIEKRIAELNKEIEISEKIMDMPELPSDYHFASVDIKNFRSEIKSLRETVETLTQ
jgi:prefoldin subunit 5